MKISKAKVEESIAQKCIELGLKSDDSNAHYVTDPQCNLINSVKNWVEIEAELGNGQGGELAPQEEAPPKFQAFHSSTALCVNTLSKFKENLSDFDFIGYRVFKKACFEKKLKTGISTANLDFYAETANSILGFESKFTETLEAKLPNQIRKRKNGEIVGNLSVYSKKFEKLNNAPKSFISVLEKYVAVKDKLYLDVAQLIKHSIGLLNKAKEDRKEPVLVYIYWVPSNWHELELYRQHEIEIAAFKNDISRHLTFISMSYLDFWSMYENNTTFSSHIKEVTNRYLLKV